METPGRRCGLGPLKWFQGGSIPKHTSFVVREEPMKPYYLLLAIAASIAAIAISQREDQDQEAAWAQDSEVESDTESETEAWFI
jgi:hypothetical protein